MEGHPEKASTLRTKTGLEFLRQGKHIVTVPEAALGQVNS